MHIIDPYIADPAQHLTFAGSLALSKGTDKGTCTRTILDLNRGELTERRMERLENLAKTMETVFQENLPTAVRRAIFKNLVANDVCCASPYAAMGKAFVDQMAALLPASVTA